MTRFNNRRHLVPLVFVCATFLAISLTNAAPGQFQGPFRTHDPSTILKSGDRYWAFSTEQGILSLWSTDLISWQPGARVFTNSPDWAPKTIPGNTGHLWAPDVIFQNGQYLLYYSVSTWGKNTSAIGLAANSTLDPKATNYAWADKGIVFQSRREDLYNAIDPAIFKDADGRLWLAFGSFWTGIKMIQLDPATGKRLASDSQIYSLAWHDSIEAPALHRRGKYYYLFVNWGLCCRGVNSTYEIRVGRSEQITGPYLDKENKDMMRDGGTLLLGSVGDRVGPGHASIFSENGSDWLSYHFYDRTRNGRSAMGVKKVAWTADNWPVVNAD